MGQQQPRCTAARTSVSNRQGSPAPLWVVSTHRSTPPGLFRASTPLSRPAAPPQMAPGPQQSSWMAGPHQQEPECVQRRTLTIEARRLRPSRGKGAGGSSVAVRGCGAGVPSQQQPVRPSVCFVSDVHDIDISEPCVLVDAAEPVGFGSHHYRTELVKHVQRPGSQPHIGRDHTRSASDGGACLGHGLGAPGVCASVLFGGGSILESFRAGAVGFGAGDALSGCHSIRRGIGVPTVAWGPARGASVGELSTLPRGWSAPGAQHQPLPIHALYLDVRRRGLRPADGIGVRHAWHATLAWVVHRRTLKRRTPPAGGRFGVMTGSNSGCCSRRAGNDTGTYREQLALVAGESTVIGLPREGGWPGWAAG